MKKLFEWCKDHVLFLSSLFLLTFIPLYPKLPLVDIKNVWVYIRIEDFLVLFVLICWAVILIRRKYTVKTPLTIPILSFWIIGTLATLHGVLLVFPDLANVFPNVAFLSLLRRIEYMSLFFIAFTGMRDKRLFPIFIGAVLVTFILVIMYALGQRYFSLPAYLTMNEEFAKGTPLQLSALSRISGTFAGHYDLAAYLVLVIPIVVSLFFAFRTIFAKAVLVGMSGIGLFVLFLTVSRISFFALFAALGLVLYIQRKKLLLLAIPVIIIGGIVLLNTSSSLVNRFGSTVDEITLLIDTKTGVPIGEAKNFPKTYFENKIVKQEYFTSIATAKTASPSSSFVIPQEKLPDSSVMAVPPKASTGEDLPQGSGYVNLALSPVIKRLTSFLYERGPNPKTGAIEVTLINGDFLIKKASAYDLSFSTRFQGEWPRALEAFKRNIFFGSGYGSVSLAVDNSYLRMLGEVGVLGFISFVSIFVIVGIYIKRTLPAVDSKPVKSFIIGLVAGIVGLAINAVFIDVFEASKIAFVLWLYIGIVIAVLHLYQKSAISVRAEFTKIITSDIAVILYLLVATVLLFSKMTQNYFVGDDFTWFKWAADCEHSITNMSKCPIDLSRIANYFVNADGFFYRPGAKVFFQVMYSLFWLNQTVYHLTSFVLHFVVTTLVYLLAKKIFKQTLLAAITGGLFLLSSGGSEAIFWISAIGFLFTSCFTLGSLLTFIKWRETRRSAYLIGSIILFTSSMLFHELGIVTPLLCIAYQWIFDKEFRLRNIFRQWGYRLLLLPIPLYLLVRFVAQSHWQGGDYSYNLLKLPFNSIGNFIGYTSLTIIGPFSLGIYETMRSVMRERIFMFGLISVTVLIVCVYILRKILKKTKKHDIAIPLFGLIFSGIALLPFLGLGNIASRYSYLASIGLLICVVYILRAVYQKLLDSGRTIASAFMILGILLFSLFHIIQLQDSHNDWHGAGQRVQNFLISMDSYYRDNYATDELELHYVQVPIRYGDAWVFPVGINDLLWLVYRNPKLKIYTWPSLEQPLALISPNSLTQFIFMFDESGGVTQVVRPQTAQ